MRSDSGRFNSILKKFYPGAKNIKKLNIFAFECINLNNNKDYAILWKARRADQ